MIHTGIAYGVGVGVGVYLGSIGVGGAKGTLSEFHLCHHPIIYIVF